MKNPKSAQFKKKSEKTVIKIVVKNETEIIFNNKKMKSTAENNRKYFY